MPLENQMSENDSGLNMSYSSIVLLLRGLPTFDIVKGITVSFVTIIAQRCDIEVTPFNYASLQVTIKSSYHRPLLNVCV